jgi:ABC-type Fe3+-siderophore transport system permease subunit
MMMSLYFVLGIFLLIAVRNPAANRSLIAFTAWSSFAHAAVMTTLGHQHASERTGFVGGSAALVVIGIMLIGLTPRSAGERASAVAVEEPAPGK